MMRDGNLSHQTNPFALDLDRPVRRGRRAFWSAARLLVFVALALSAVVFAGRESRRWLLGRLTEDFANLSAEQKRSRLPQIAEFGDSSVPHLVLAMADRDLAVARSAHELLRQMQNEWTTIEPRTMLSRLRTMVDALDHYAIQIPDDRTGWISGLLQQAIMETVESPDGRYRALHRRAADALARLSLTERPGPSVLRDAPGASIAPIRIAAKSVPLPVEQLADAQWTSWPPENPAAQEDGDQNASGRRWADPVSGPQEQRTSDPSVQGEQGTASLYRSPPVPLSPLEMGQTPKLDEIDRRGRSAREAESIQRSAHLIDSPLATFDDRSVMHWLASSQSSLRERARQELSRRSYSDKAIAIAERIAAGDIPTRLEVIDQIARSRQLDPRPWLLMLLGDDNRDVKLRAISALATMDDPAIRSRLRMQLGHEQDPTVAARIKRVLELR